MQHISANREKVKAVDENTGDNVENHSAKDLHDSNEFFISSNTSNVVDFARIVADRSPPIFATYALALRNHGLAVIPIGIDRKPFIAGFNKCRCAPTEARVRSWINRFPDAMIAIIPGLSAGGILVIDCDTMEAAAEFQARFGPSNLRVRTSRGLHLYYRRVSFRLPGNLKKFGLNIDVKIGNSLVIAPHSIHKNGRHVYRLDDGCEWSTLTDGTLAKVDQEKLREFVQPIEQARPAASPKQAPPADAREMRDDSREQCLNDMVLRAAINGISRDEVMSMAFQLNQTFAGSPKGRLTEDRILERTRQAWEDAQEGLRTGKFTPWGKGRHRSVVRNTIDEIDSLPPDAFKLLAKLRAEHSARCERDETFAIAATAWAKTKTFMSRHRIEKARAILIEKGFVERVAFSRITPAGRIAAQYRLITR